MPAAKSIHLVGGNDEFTIKEHAAKLAEQLRPKNNDFGLEVIDGASANEEEALKSIQRLREALFAGGLFCDEKLVWWKNATALSVAGATAMVTEAVDDLTETLKAGLPDGVRLLISASGIDKRRSFFKTVQKLGSVDLFDLPELDKKGGREALEEFLQERLERESKQMDYEARELFQELVSPNFREMANELEKLFIYVGKRARITAEDVHAICSATRQAAAFQITEHLGSRNLRGALATLKALFDEGEQALGILAMMVNHFRFMLLSRDLMERKVLVPSENGFDYVKRFAELPPEQTAHIPLSKEGKSPAWRLFFCAKASRNFTTAELIRAMDILQEANIRLVSTQLDDRLILEETCTRIVGLPKRAPAR